MTPTTPEPPEAPAACPPATVTITRTVTQTHSLATNRDALDLMRQLMPGQPEWIHGHVSHEPPVMVLRRDGRWHPALAVRLSVKKDVCIILQVLHEDGLRFQSAPTGNLRPVSADDLAAPFCIYDPDGSEGEGPEA